MKAASASSGSIQFGLLGVTGFTCHSWPMPEFTHGNEYPVSDETSAHLVCTVMWQ